MTFREKLKREHPKMVNERYVGGCNGCPEGYGYEDDVPNCHYMTCTECWNREIPVSEALNCSDLISRQAAIDAIHCNIVITGRENAEIVAKTIGEIADRIKALPTIQSEHAEGEWVQIQRCTGDAQPDLECPFCKHIIGWWDMGRYCAGCGAKLKGGAE